MPAGRYDLIIEKGATFNRVITLTDANGALINLTGFTARMHIREYVASAATILELTTENIRIALGGAAGTVTLTLTPALTTAVTQTDGKYDLELVSAGGVVERLIEGSVKFVPEVTHP